MRQCILTCYLIFHTPRSILHRLLPNQSFIRTESLFIRLLGIVYLIAFASLWPQIVGLIGVNGVSPAADTMAGMHLELGWHAYYYLPSFFWLHPSDAALVALCIAGCLAGLSLVAGFFIRSAALLAYLLYLSLVSIGQPFTSFQWDALLLETGFLAIFVGSPLIPLAYRFLLFRLMFESGLVKLTSGDSNWRNLHALRYHFFTQPLPTPLAYYAHQLPCWLLDSLTAITLCIEFVAPFFLFLGHRAWRRGAVVLLVALQIGISLTGNYGFFNLLTVVLCLWGLDDSSVAWFAPKPAALPKFFRAPADAAVAVLLLLSFSQITGFQPPLLEPFELVNSYGLFAVMTTTRPELVIEGSKDGLRWEEYDFRWKPGDISRSLPWIAPYQPRLDWQMWFAALDSPRANLWVETLAYRLLGGQTEVLRLLEPSAFAKPPKLIRIQLYRYSFVNADEPRNGLQVVWKRTLLRPWLGPISLQEH